MRHLIYIGIILVLVWLTGCVSLDKAKERLLRDRREAAEFCADNFPPKISTETKTDTITKIEEVPGPTVNCPDTINPTTGKTYTPTVQCPPCKQETKYVNTTTTNTVENTARVEELTLKNEKLEQELGKETDTRKKLTWFGIIMMLVSAGLLFGLVRK